MVAAGYGRVSDLLFFVYTMFTGVYRCFDVHGGHGHFERNSYCHHFV